VKYLGAVLVQSIALRENGEQAGKTLAACVGPLRKFVHGLDAAREAAESMAKVSKASSYETVAVNNVLSRVNPTLAQLYSSFFECREGMYRVAEMSGVPTKRFAKRGAKSDAASASNGQLESEIESLAGAMGETIDEVKQAGEKLLADAEAASKSWGEGMAGDLIASFLDFRDMASTAVFARLAGIVKRLHVRAKRSKRKAPSGPDAEPVAAAPAPTRPAVPARGEPEVASRQRGAAVTEAADTKVPWSADPELGGAEL
jgi:hypothetical protein